MAGRSPLIARWHRWIIVPALAWGGILAMVALPFRPPFLSFGSLGCLLGSFAIAALAYTRQKKDIVSLCIPVVAIFAFFPKDVEPGLAFLVVYAVSLTLLVIRLEYYFPE